MAFFCLASIQVFKLFYIYATLLSKATYSAFRLYIFCQYVCSLGIEPTTFALLQPLSHRNTICFLCLLVLHGTRTGALRFTKANCTGCATEQVYFVGKVIHMELIMGCKLVHYMVKAFLKWKHNIVQGNIQLLTINLPSYHNWREKE